MKRLVALLLLTACTDGEPVGPDWKPCEISIYLTFNDSTLVTDSTAYEGECGPEGLTLAAPER